MVYRKWLALLVVLIMGMSILAGCSPAEKNYYSLMSEVGSQEVFEDSGSYIIDLTTLPAGMFTGQDAISAQTLDSALGQLKIEFKGKVDMNKDSFQYDYIFFDNRTKAEKGAFSVVYKNNVMYIKIDQLLNFMEQFCTPAEKQNLDRIFAGVQWVSISDQEMSALMPEGSQPGMTSQLLQKSSRQNLVFKKLFDGLINDVYDGYSADLVTQSGNKYTLTLRGADLMDVIKSGAVYTINNIDKLGMSLKNFLNGLSPAEAAQLGITYEAKLQALQSLDVMIAEVKQDSQSAMWEIENLSAASEAEMQNVLNDSEIISSIEKTSPTSYNVTSRIHLNITGSSLADRLDCTFSANQTIKTGGAVEVTIPTGAISITVLQGRMPRQMTVYIDSGYYTSSNGLFCNNGQLSVQMVDGRTYLPLRMVGESLGETVGWDPAAHQAYVLQNGQRINMTGIIVNSRTYIKMRDFEKLGFAVGWNDYTRMVTVEK